MSLLLRGVSLCTLDISIESTVAVGLASLREKGNVFCHGGTSERFRGGIDAGEQLLSDTCQDYFAMFVNLIYEDDVSRRSQR